MTKCLKKNGFLIVLISSIVGALIPICTCGMIPLASKLQRKGVSWVQTMAFLTSGNACSVTALFLTFLLGVGITVGRFIFAVIVGLIIAYLFVYIFKPKSLLVVGENGHSNQVPEDKLKQILNESFVLLKSFGPWVLAAIFIAALVSTFLNPIQITALSGVDKIYSPFLMIGLGFPFYFCAGADVPISTAFIDKGAGLGSVLAFMTAAGGINLTTLFIYQRWIGFKHSVIYLLLSAIVIGVMGLIVNFAMLPISAGFGS